MCYLENTFNPLNPGVHGTPDVIVLLPVPGPTLKELQPNSIWSVIGDSAAKYSRKGTIPVLGHLSQIIYLYMGKMFVHSPPPHFSVSFLHFRITASLDCKGCLPSIFESLLSDQGEQKVGWDPSVDLQMGKDFFPPTVSQWQHPKGSHIPILQTGLKIKSVVVSVLCFFV